MFDIDVECVLAWHLKGGVSYEDAKLKAVEHFVAQGHNLNEAVDRVIDHIFRDRSQDN